MRRGTKFFAFIVFGIFLSQLVLAGSGKMCLSQNQQQMMDVNSTHSAHLAQANKGHTPCKDAQQSHQQQSPANNESPNSQHHTDGCQFMAPCTSGLLLPEVTTVNADLIIAIDYAVNAREALMPRSHALGPEPPPPRA